MNHMTMTATSERTGQASARKLERLRADFPSLSGDEIYLDSAASSLTPRQVLEAMSEYYLGFRANVNRGSYRSSMLASERYQKAHDRIAGFFGADPDELVLTMNATHALNLIALSLPFSPGDELIVPTLEHASNMMPWVRVAKTTGARIRWWNPDSTGRLQMADLRALLSERTRLLSVGHVSNVIGTLAPVEEIGQLCRERNIWFVLDACQSAPHLAVDVHAIGCDFMVASAHKMLGPTGAGALYVRREVAERIEPAIIGSDSVDNSSCPGMSACSAGQMPTIRWATAGTPPIAEALGWAAALDYLEGVGLDVVHAHSRHLLSIVLEGTRKMPGMALFGPADLEGRTSLLSFNLLDIPNEELGRILSESFGISVRAGTHCARGYFMENQPGVEAYGNVRASFYVYNTEDDARKLVSALGEIASTLAA